MSFGIGRLVGLACFLSAFAEVAAPSALGQEAQNKVAGRVFNVKSFGAKGDDRTDDTAAIQAALDAASKAGGGKVYLPKGTYLVRPSSGGVFGVANNTQIAGDGPSSIIKIPSGAGKYDVIFYAEAGENLSFQDFRVDQNPTGNAASPVGGDGNLAVVISNQNYKNLKVQRVRFEPASGVWAILVTGSKGDQLLVEDCFFEFVNGRVGKSGNDKSYDVSVIYTQGGHQRIVNNVFKTKLSEYGHTAIEIQGTDIVLRKNVIDYFDAAVIVTNSLPGDTEFGPVVIEGNQFLHLQAGVVFWASTNRVLRNVRVTGNEITLTKRSWLAVYNGISQVLYDGAPTENDPDTYRGDVSDIVISNNTITFLDVPSDYKNNAGQVTGGINFDSVGNASNIQISGNKIIDSPVVGIHLGNAEANNSLSNVRVEDNEIINPGWNEAAKREYRAAVRLDGQLSSVQFMNNRIKRTGSRGRQKGVRAFWGHPKSVKNVTLKGNSVDSRDEMRSDLDPAISSEK